MSLMFLQACAQSVKESQTEDKEEKKTVVKQTPPKEDRTKKKMGMGLVMFHCM